MTAYRDAIQYVHDQTVRLMNKGLTGRQCAEVESWWCDLSGLSWVNRTHTALSLAAAVNTDFSCQRVRLPPHLRHHPYLIEYYGTVEWSVR